MKEFVKLDWESLDRKSIEEPFLIGKATDNSCTIYAHILESSAEELCWDLTIRNELTGYWLSRGGVSEPGASVDDCKSKAQRALNVLWKSRNDTAW